ncbi:AmmeMemoRadiSam system protein A [Quatrionicoccus australiensis]|uniref:AmmeMemoRadiSam system protein A n=1 Tax=Quatrionicoccus australiensis TaxID=138118 RepID=UPI001CF91601|nr:AmmeMemoRadiSam system protein A [Quatrionicoccus australiensis]UCV16797.1 AmmeMemoRadiSam system protein A [Quatrionicoccus australiensis]
MSDLGSSLLTLARHAITSRFVESGLLAHQPGLPPGTVDLPELHKMGATFVTLSQRGQLRGCIGSLEAWRPLLQDVQENARAAAFRDPRFKPLGVDELGRTRVEVSLLTPATPIQFASEADALAQLQPGRDGIIFTAGGRRSTFLPQVWEQLPEPADFMAHLKQKAGLPATYWGDDVRLERYAVMKWQENTP